MATSAKDVGKVLATLPARASGSGGALLRRLFEIAVDGVPPLPGAKEMAAKHFQRRGSVEAAADAIIVQHVVLASAQGFATNIGGLLTALITTPANLTGVAIIQMRMVAGIAHLRGYDIDDPRVRTAAMMCLLGEDELARQIKVGQLPTSPLAVATAPVFEADLDQHVAERVLNDLVTSIGGKRIGSMIGKEIPLIGGGVGMLTDGFLTRQIGLCAKKQLVSRRPISPS